MSAPQSEAFQKAVVDSKKLTSKPNNDQLLDLYGKFSLSKPADIIAKRMEEVLTAK